jgi:hypothetical protein
MSVYKYGIILSALLLIAALVPAPVVADDVWPPEWRDSTRTTQQHWEYSDSSGEWPPDYADNPYGDPGTAYINSDGWIWYNTYEGRTGVVYYAGTNMLRFENIANVGTCVRKEIWIQTTYRGNHYPTRFEVFTSGGAAFFDNPPLMGIIDHANDWHTTVHWLELDNCPDWETIMVEFEGPVSFWVDQVVIDTFCPLEDLCLCCSREMEGFNNWPTYPHGGDNCNEYVVAQSFTPQTAFNLCKVNVVLQSPPGQGNQSATLYVQDGPGAGANVYVSASASGISESNPGNWYTFDVPDTMLSALTTYYIRVSGNVTWKSRDTNPYANGVAYRNGVAGVPNRDQWFMTYTYEYQECPCVDKIPTLTEWGLIILVLLLITTAVWMLRKRKYGIENHT